MKPTSKRLFVRLWFVFACLEVHGQEISLVKAGNAEEVAALGDASDIALRVTPSETSDVVFIRTQLKRGGRTSVRSTSSLSGRGTSLARIFGLYIHRLV